MAGAWSDTEVLLLIEMHTGEGRSGGNYRELRLSFRNLAPTQWKSAVGDYYVCFPHFIFTTRTCFAVTSVNGG